MIKLFIRENGNPPAKWWKNYALSVSGGESLSSAFLGMFIEHRIKEDLAKQDIEFKDNGTWQITAWLEFKTEEQKNWFLLRWS